MKAYKVVRVMPDGRRWSFSRMEQDGGIIYPTDIMPARPVVGGPLMACSSVCMARTELLYGLMDRYVVYAYNAIALELWECEYVKSVHDRTWQFGFPDKPWYPQDYDVLADRITLTRLIETRDLTAAWKERIVN